MSFNQSTTDAFFLNRPVTRAECDTYAWATFGGPAEPVDPQGSFSYTVTVTADDGTVIVQFRDKSSVLPPFDLGDDDDLLERVHGDLVSSAVRGDSLPIDTETPLPSGGEIPFPVDTEALLSMVEAQRGLDVYVMDKLPGVNLFHVDLDGIGTRGRLTFVESLARFFAQSWTRGRPRHLMTPEKRVQMADTCRSRLDALDWSLYNKYQTLIEGVRAHVDQLFCENYPIVLTHGDLGELNMLVDEASGKLTGVVDWAEASWLPFGFALYALDSALGKMTGRGWQPHRDAKELRERFWYVFEASGGRMSPEQRRLAGVARLAGILYRYGTPRGSGFAGMLGIGGVDNGTRAFLNAFVAFGEDEGGVPPATGC